MKAVQTSFEIPDAIAQGLADGTLTRIGGVIRNTSDGRIVAFLRETVSAGNLLSGLNLGVSVINLGVSVLTLGTSLLNLGVSVIGFSTVINHLDRLEEELKTTREILLKANEHLARKIDLSFYANFAAALKLANNAFGMVAPENRRVSAMQAINRFLEAEEHYVKYAEELLESKSRGVEQYLLTLALAYIAESRCYLELEELGAARRRLQEGTATLHRLAKQHVEILLTSNPSAYLHPILGDEITLSRLTRVYQWILQNPSVDENTIFQAQRENCFTLYRQFDNWTKSIPDAVWEHVEFKGSPDTFRQLPKVMERIEAIIETCQRLEAYEQEIRAIQELGFSFREWSYIPIPEAEQATELQIMYLLTPEPV